MIQKSKLQVDKLTVEANIGWGKLERSKKQQIHILYSLEFLSTPAALETDNLDDTICYASLSSKIVKFIHNGEFKLIEHLAAKIYEIIKNEAQNTKVKVTIVKPHADVENLNGAVKFSVGDALC